jgi:hypothetical protein
MGQDDNLKNILKEMLRSCEVFNTQNKHPMLGWLRRGDPRTAAERQRGGHQDGSRGSCVEHADFLIYILVLTTQEVGLI